MEINYILFTILIVVVAIESVLIYNWVPIYFKVGIPLYSKLYLLNCNESLSIDVDLLNAALSRKNSAKVVVREIGPGIFAFRQKYIQISYAPIMRGLIEINTELNKIKVSGYLNVSIIAFFVVFLILFGFAIFPMLIAVLGVMFYFDRRSYVFIGMFLSNEGNREL